MESLTGDAAENGWDTIDYLDWKQGEMAIFSASWKADNLNQN